MQKKVSPTKQMEQIFGTADKTKQVQILGNLVRSVQSPKIAVTVLYFDGQIDLAVASSSQIKPEDMKRVLQAGIDEITRRTILYEQQKEAQDALTGPADIDVPDPVLPADKAGD